MALILILVVGILETEVRVVEETGGLLQALEALFPVVCAAEDALRLAVARYNPRYGSAWRHACTPAAILDPVVLVSFVSPRLGLETTVFRLLRLARRVRLARMGRHSRAMTLLDDATRARGPELAISAMIATALMLAAASLLWRVEAESQPEAFGSIPRAMWWAVATLTTVGYGDIVPVTVLGRLCAALTALCGVGINVLATGVLAGAIADAIRKARAEQERVPPAPALPDDAPVSYD